jgi:hypothetical protein
MKSEITSPSHFSASHLSVYPPPFRIPHFGLALEQEVALGYRRNAEAV